MGHNKGHNKRKEGRKMKKIFKKTAALLMVLALAVGLVAPLNAEAAAKKKVTAKTDFAKSPKVKVKKNYLVTAKEYGDGGGVKYVQFTAPSKGTYVFTLKNLTKHGESTNDVIMNGTAELCAFQYTNEIPTSIKIKIGGEEVYSIYLCSRYSWSLKDKSKIDAYTYLPERSVKCKMNKGDTIYVSFNFIDKCDVELNIKKK